MNYIVMDLEWNQSSTRQEEEVATLPFEIIEIGAIKMNAAGVMISEFSRLIKPSVYQEMNPITSNLIHIQMQELERGQPFPDVAEEFLEWCGEESYLFCTWSTLDLTELQTNMKFYNMAPLSDGPIAYLDVQKLFSLAYEDGKSRRTLEYGVDMMGIEKDLPFHRAFSDAYYTARILTLIVEQHKEVLQYVSYDLFHPPKCREQEIHIQFDNYAKYISREFRSKTQAFEDKEVCSSKCFECHRNLRKKLRWFTLNGRHYYCLAYCEQHGYLKGKIRIRRSEDKKLYIVKTVKLISPEEAEALKESNRHARKMRRGF